MSDRRPLLRDLIQAFFDDYLRLVEPDSAARMWLDRITFPRLETLTAGGDDGLREIDVVAEVPSHRGELVTVLVRIEPEAPTAPEIARRIGHYLMGLELRYGQPVLLSVLYLQGGRPGIHLESGVISEACGIDLVRIYYTSFAIEGARAEYYLERPEPLSWLFATLMHPVKRTPEEHARACRERIAAAPLDEERRRLLLQAADTFLPVQRVVA